MSALSRYFVALAAVAAAFGGAPAAPADNGRDGVRYQHVLLISVDGMHAVDLTNYISANPLSNLAGFAGSAVIYPNALTTAPSDSFPGLLALVTGGTPKSTGVFYDNSYDRNLFAPGSNCQGPAGANTVFDESIDNDPKATNAGGILGQPVTQINPAALPMALVKGACVPVYPHDFIEVNTLFEVIRAHGGRTAWSDKHPAYDLVNGPSGAGVEDLFTPEVNSNDSVTGQDTTTGFHSVQRNDFLKVQSILNEIDGLDSTGQHKIGVVPTIFGMNFQAVSVGQKLAKGNKNDPMDAGLIGGYADPLGSKPNNGLQSGLDFVDFWLGQMILELRNKGLLGSTLVIITAKHGQSPINSVLRQAVDDSPYGNTPGIAQFTTDDVGLVWLAPKLQQKDYAAAKNYLLAQANALRIDTLLDKSDLANLYGNPFGNNRTPDFIAITKPGVIYTSGSKLAEHGGFAHDDRNVALMVYNPALVPNLVSDQVETRQIAPSILQALSISPNELDSVRRENTNALPGLQ